MNANHQRWKNARAANEPMPGLTLGHAADLFGSRAIAAVRHRVRRRGMRYAADKLRAHGIGLGMARLLLLGRA